MSLITDKQPSDDAVAFVDKHRWELASAVLTRSDHSADVLRAALLAVTTAAIGSVMQNTDPLGAHVISLVLFGAAAFCVLWSWDIQKGKASARLKALRDDGAAEYLAKPENFKWDRTAAGLIGAGAIAETILRLHL
jgi:hypothetical protein